MNYELEITKTELEVRKLQRKIEHLKDIELLKRCELILKLAKYEIIERIPGTENYLIYDKRNRSMNLTVNLEYKNKYISRRCICTYICNKYYSGRFADLTQKDLEILVNYNIRRRG